MEHAKEDVVIRIRRLRIDQSRYAPHACAETSSVGGRRASTGRSPSATCLELFCAKKLEIKVKWLRSHEPLPIAYYECLWRTTAIVTGIKLRTMSNEYIYVSSLSSVKVTQSNIRIVWSSLTGRLIIYLCNGITITYVSEMEPPIFLLEWILSGTYIVRIEL